MSCVQLSGGFSRWFTPLACGPWSLELSSPIRIWLVSCLHIYILAYCANMVLQGLAVSQT